MFRLFQRLEKVVVIMGTELLSQGFASTGKVLAGVSPDQLSASTPCASWTVRDLINHIVGGTTFFAVTAETGAAPTGEASDFTTGDYVSEFKEGAARAVQAFEAEGAMEKMMKLPFAELPGSVFVNIASVDTFTHGWDLARATGQPTDLSPELAAELLALAQGFLPDSLRGQDGQAPFGPKVEPAAGACAADQLAAFLGRRS
jgi:uncharacterized protein (TIGR03086 family)